MFLRSPVCGIEINCRVQMCVKAPSFGGALIYGRWNLWSKNILRLVNRGHKNLVFSDIIKTYNDLNAELGQQGTAKE